MTMILRHVKNNNYHYSTAVHTDAYIKDTWTCKRHISVADKCKNSSHEICCKCLLESTLSKKGVSQAKIQDGYHFSRWMPSTLMIADNYFVSGNYFK